MSELLEAAMIVAFGVSWPISIAKSYKSRSTHGKSLGFLIMITLGYVFGIAGKIVGHKITYVLFFYCLNLAMLVVELLLYARNRKLEKSDEDSHSA